MTALRYLLGVVAGCVRAARLPRARSRAVVHRLGRRSGGQAVLGLRAGAAMSDRLSSQSLTLTPTVQQRTPGGTE